jgi:hypothetical protein
MCLDCFNYKSMSRKVRDSNLHTWMFKFIKNLTQIMNNFSKVQQNENNLIYADMVKVLW